MRPPRHVRHPGPAFPTLALPLVVALFSSACAHHEVSAIDSGPSDSGATVRLDGVGEGRLRPVTSVVLSFEPTR